MTDATPSPADQPPDPPSAQPADQPPVQPGAQPPDEPHGLPPYPPAASASAPPSRADADQPYDSQGSRVNRDQPQGTPGGAWQPQGAPGAAWSQPHGAPGGAWQPPGAPGAAWSQPPSGGSAWALPPHLRGVGRSRADRMVAGVAGGVAHRLGVDALLLRVLLVVLAFFGGAGIFLYCLGWLLLPDDDGRGKSLLEAARERQPGRGRTLLIAAALVTTLVVSSLWVFTGQVIPALLIVLSAIAVLLYARRDVGRPTYPYAQSTPAYAGAMPGASSYAGGPFAAADPARGYAPPASPTGPYGPTAAAASPYGGTSTAPDPYLSSPPTSAYAGSTPGPYAVPPPSASVSTGPAAAPAAGGSPGMASFNPGQPEPGAGPRGPYGAMPTAPAGYRTPAYASAPYSATPTQTSPAAPTWGAAATEQAAPQGPAGQPPPPPPPTSGSGSSRAKPPRARRERSYLGLLTISTMLLALGVLAAVDALGAVVYGAAYVALALGIVGLGLLVGTWVGRARGLIAAGLLLGAALVPTAFLDAATDGDWARAGEWSNAETVRFTPATAADIKPRYHLESGRLIVDLRDVDLSGSTVQSEMSVSAGELLVLVPADADVTASATVEIGSLELLDDRSDGLNLDSNITVPGAGDGAALILDLDVNVGTLEVRREAA